MSFPRTLFRRARLGLAVAAAAVVAVIVSQMPGLKAAGPSTLVTAVTVPWQGIPGQAHVIGDTAGTTTIIVQGVAYAAGTSNYANCAQISQVRWDFGDGASQVIACNAVNLGVSHTYPVSVVGTPYTATLTLTDTSGNTSSANFRISVQPKSIDLEANMAIDKGLWYLHTSLSRGVNGTVKVGNWSSTTVVSGTATSINAFEVNNHLPSGDALVNPYVDDVQRALAYLGTGQSLSAGDPVRSERSVHGELLRCRRLGPA